MTALEHWVIRCIIDKVGGRQHTKEPTVLVVNKGQSHPISHALIRCLILYTLDIDNNIAGNGGYLCGRSSRISPVRTARFNLC